MWGVLLSLYLFLISLFLFILIALTFVFKLTSRKNTNTETIQTETTVYNNHVVLEEMPLSEKEVFVYADHFVSNNIPLFIHTMDFFQKYVYPKKSFKRLSIEQKTIPNQTSILVYTDSSELYMLTFNEKYRIVGYKKKSFEEPFKTYISDKEKVHFNIEKRA